MNETSTQAGASTPETHTITGSTLRLALAAARMTGLSLDEVLKEYIEAGFEGEMDYAGRRGDSNAVLVAVEADPSLRLEVVNRPDTRGTPITLEAARLLLQERPQTILRALRPESDTQEAA
jgi:hypothetical protein